MGGNRYTGIQLSNGERITNLTQAEEVLWQGEAERKQDISIGYDHIRTSTQS